MKLPKIGNRQAPRDLTTTGARPVAALFQTRLAALDKVSQARMSSILNSAEVTRRASVAEGELKQAQIASKAAQAQADALSGIGKAKGAAIMASSSERLANTIASEFESYRRNEVESEVGKFRSKFKQYNADWEEAHASRQYYPANEIPEEVKAHSSLPEGGPDVPAYKVRPEWRRRDLEEFVLNQSSSISDEWVRKKTIDVAMGEIATIFGREVKAAAAGQKDFLIGESLRNADDLAREGNFAGAVEEITNSLLSPKDKNTKITGYHRGEQDNYFTNIAMADPSDPATIVVSERALKLLRDGDEATTKYLSNSRKEHFTNTLARNIKAHKDAIAKQQKTQVDGVISLARKAKDLAWERGVVSADYSQLLATVRTDKRLTSQNLAKEMDLAKAAADSIQHMIRQPIDVQNNQLQALKKSRDGGDTQLAYLSQKLIDGMVANRKQQVEDPIGWAIENRVAEIPPFSLDNFSQVMPLYVQAAETMERDFRVFRGYLPAAKAKEVAVYFNDAPKEEKLRVAGMINQVFQNDPVKISSFLEQLERSGAEGTSVMATRMASTGNPITANKIMEGDVVIKNSPEYMEPVQEKKIRQAVTAITGHMYAMNHREKKMVDDSVVRVMAYERARTGQRGSVGNLDTDMLEEAVKEVAGDFIKFGRAFIPVPPRTDPRLFEEWIEEADARVFNSTENGVRVREMLDGGDLVPIAVSAGRYALRNDRGQLVMNRDGSEFIMTYDPDYPRRPKRGLKKLFKLAPAMEDWSNDLPPGM